MEIVDFTTNTAERIGRNLAPLAVTLLSHSMSTATPAHCKQISCHLATGQWNWITTDHLSLYSGVVTLLNFRLEWIPGRSSWQVSTGPNVRRLKVSLAR